ncbi:hypothetical protein [Cupriavidus sp. D39]|uniref:hypothetical protein n=1 Tax=Cupriavidus sp. D39 TaxID=2997877 RepID=UPI002271D053|nr:hypothetical protein [Cupriavidus sp. D39]MCY0855025.1 hypothetical protein [Cupriavidus sp. D39]
MMCQKIAGLVNLLRLLFSAVAVFACVGVSINAVAAPVTYTMFAVTDVSLDGHFYHNAQVHLKFVGDTIDIKKLDPPVDGVTGYKITKGRSTLLIITGGRNIRAEFKPHQLLVSLDTSNGGGGFSSYVGADHHLEPAYPLAIDGTSINDANNARDLISPRAYTGHAWSCIGFPHFLMLAGVAQIRRLSR